MDTAAKQTGKQKVQKLHVSQTHKLRKMAEVEAGTPCELGGPRRARSCPSDSRCLKMNIGALWEYPPATQHNKSSSTSEVNVTALCLT